MIKYILKSAKKSSVFITSTLVVTLLMATVPSSIGSIVTSKLNTSESISQYGRGSYDILVRPEISRSEIERKKGVVEENYLTGGNGGISNSQVDLIRKINGVQIVAPVSVLGFYTYETGGVLMNLPKDSNSAMITNVTLSTKTGLPDEYNAKLITNIVTFPDKEVPYIPNRSLDIGTTPSGTYETTFTLPNTYHLVVGVDPEQEDSLANMNGKIKSRLNDQLIFEKSRKSTGQKSVTGKDIPIIPLLVNDDVQIPLRADVKIIKPKENPEDLLKELLKVHDMSKVDSVLAHDLNISPIIAKSYDLTKFLQPLSVQQLRLNDDGTVEHTGTGINSFLDISKHYQSDRLQYKISTDGRSDLTLIPNDTGKTESYRNLQETSLSANEAIDHVLYDLNVVGDFHGNEITNGKQDPSPLGIYSFSPVTQIEDAKGNKVSIPLQKDFTPDTFLPIQATALTNLKAAEILKGDHPIDAIRIRVGGITKYDETAQTKILKVAQTIQEVTGLHTDIVAGASKQNVKVTIPAVGTHPAVGIVQEVWTTLGVATHITNAVNLLSICIMAALALIVIVYSMVHTRTLFILRQNEFAILQAVGWEKRDIRKMLLLEWTFKSMIAFVLSLVVLVVLHPYISFSGYWIVSVGIQVVMIGLLLLSVLLTVNKIQDRQLKLGQRGEWKRNFVAPRSIWAMARGNFIGHLTYNVLNLVLITISGAVGFFTLNFILAEQKNIGSTFLGEVVNASIHNSQWMVVVATLSMILFGLLETTRSLAVSRKQEIYVLQIVGWSRGQVTRMIVGEKALIFGIGFLGAAVLGFGAFRLFFEQFPWSLLGQVGIAFALLVLLLVLSTAYLRKLTAKIA